MGERTLQEDVRARHDNVLQTPENREEFGHNVADVLDMIARAASEAAHKFRMNPKAMLEHAFHPNIIGMPMASAAEFEMSYVADKSPLIAIKGKARMGMNELGFRVVWKDGDVRPVRDNSLGG